MNVVVDVRVADAVRDDVDAGVEQLLGVGEVEECVATRSPRLCASSMTAR